MMFSDLWYSELHSGSWYSSEVQICSILWWSALQPFGVSDCSCDLVNYLSKARYIVELSKKSFCKRKLKVNLLKLGSSREE